MNRTLRWTLLLAAPLLVSAAAAPDAPALRKLLDEFLAGAARGDAAVHERFWADDLIYTGSSGRRVSKADILREVHAEPAPPPGQTGYSAEDVRIQQYGSTAIVAFRLVANTRDSTGAHVMKFHNSGTFVKRAGRWQAVCWQATRIPDPVPENAGKKE